ncbi:IST1-like protein [Glycine soja]
MGLLGKSFTSKFKSISLLAVSRIVILKNQHKARASYARSDVAQLLNLGYHDRALLRVEQWIIEQNMLEVFAMIESYCNFLRERAEALERNKECLVELKEATSSLVFASSRCGEFPELHKIREMFTTKFGKEFADHAVELHKNNRVNSKMIQKLSPRRPNMEIKMKALKQIASEIGVNLRLEQDPILINEDKLSVDRKQDEPETRKSRVDGPSHKENIQNNPANTIQDENLSDKNEERKRYMDTDASVAEKAIESKPSGIEVSKQSDHRVALGKMHAHPIASSSSKQEGEVAPKNNHAIELKGLERREIKKQFAWEESHLSQNPRDDVITSRIAEFISKEHVEEENREGRMVGELGSAKSFQMDNNDHNSLSESDAATENEHFSEERVHPSSHATRWNSQRSQSDSTLNPMARRHVMETRDPTHFQKQIHTRVDWKVMSARTR